MTLIFHVHRFIFVLFLLILVFCLPSFGGDEDIYARCQNGFYLTQIGCDRLILIDHLFSGSTDSMIELDEPFPVDEALGFNIQNFAIPNRHTDEIFVQYNSRIRDPAYGNLPSFGLPYVNDRNGIIWWNSAPTDSLTSLQKTSGLHIDMRKQPSGANSSLDAPNDLFWKSQQQVFQGTLNTGFDYCPEYSSTILIPGTNRSESDVQNYFANHFADASILCIDCERRRSKFIHFRGSLWVIDVGRYVRLYYVIILMWCCNYLH